jgi:chromate transporter
VTLSPGEGESAVPFREALPTWIRVALLSFGGPAGQIAVMHRLLVEERKWIADDRFLHAMSYCMLLPGPEAQQLATYIGWLLHGRRGGLLAGLLFILPGFASIYALSVLYAGYHDTALFAALFFGLKPAVIAVVVAALVRMGRRTLTTVRHRAIAAGAFIAIFFLGVWFPVIVVVAGVVGYLSGSAGTVSTAGSPRSRPSIRATARSAAVWLAIWWLPVAGLAVAAGRASVFVREALFFSRSAVVTFGGAYAVLAYVAQKAVESYHWLLPGEMLDGLGMAETTPGPLIQVVQFVGFMGASRQAGAMSPLLAGTLGAFITTWVTFVPCFLFVFVGAPWAEHLRGNGRLNAALSSITAAVVGVILNLGVWFALHTLFADVAAVRFGPVRALIPEWTSLSWASTLLAIGASIAMIRYRVGMLPTLAAATMFGFLYSVLVH